MTEAVTSYTASTTEKDLMQAIIQAARLRGFLVYHTHDARRSEAGFPDLVLLRARDGKRLAIECKTTKGKPTDEQLDWIQAFAACGIPSMVVRPADLDFALELLR